MVWLEGSLLLLLFAGRLLPALLDMSKVGLWHRGGCQHGCVPTSPRRCFPIPQPTPVLKPKGGGSQPTFASLILSFLPGAAPSLGAGRCSAFHCGCKTQQWAPLAPREKEDGV